MKRDIDIIKLLLLQQEGEDVQSELEKYDDKLVVYNTVLVIEAGLAIGITVKDQTGIEVSVTLMRLTWEGHDFLDSARDIGAWNHAKELAKKSGGSLSFGVLKAVLTGYVKSELGV